MMSNLKRISPFTVTHKMKDGNDFGNTGITVAVLLLLNPKRELSLTQISSAL